MWGVLPGCRPPRAAVFQDAECLLNAEVALILETLVEQDDFDQKPSAE